MTITEAAGEARDLAKECWWNGAGVVVVLFAVVTAIWSRPHNDYLVYAALVVLSAHCYISALSYARSRWTRKYQEGLAVALKPITQEPETTHERVVHQPLAGRRREPQMATERRPTRHLAVSG